MNKRCIRCGKDETFRIIDEQYRLCADCYQDFVEFLQGAPVLKWNPVKVRKMTDEERAELIDGGYDPEDIEEVTMIEGFTPEDGQEILITYKGSISGRLYVEHDEAVSDGEDNWLDSGRGWENVTAWAAMPEAYKPEEDGGGTNGD